MLNRGSAPRDFREFRSDAKAHLSIRGRAHPLHAGYPGGDSNPPTTSDNRAANSIEVPSSHIGPTICMPTGRPALVRPTGATVAGNPAKVANLIQNGSSCA